MSDRPTAPRLPATDAGTTAGSRYEAPGPADVLRRIADLLIGDLIAKNLDWPGADGYEDDGETVLRATVARHGGEVVIGNSRDPEVKGTPTWCVSARRTRRSPAR